MDKLSATGLSAGHPGRRRKKPLLGIYLGMQLLFEKAMKYGEHGAWAVKVVCPLEPDLKDKTLKVPQIGWDAHCTSCR